MNNFVLTAQNLHKFYGEKHAVRGVDLSIARGEVFGLLGPNGAGKTTTLHMFTGLLMPDKGRIMLNGKPLTPRDHALKAAIGLVPQEIALYFPLSGRENLNFFGQMYGLGGCVLRRRVEAALEMVGLSERADDPIATYSGGMQRRLNIAAALLHEPEILILDEPTVGIDPQSRNAIFESVESLKRNGMTIIYTTHYMEEAQRLCDRIAIMDQGQIIALDTPQALIQRVGGGLIRLGLQDGLSSSFAQHAAQLPVVRNITARDGEFFIETYNASQALLDLLELAKHLGARITSLQILEPNLETVFLNLTGKHLRD